MSVEWLIDQLHSHIGHIDVLDVAELNGYFDKAKEMDKEQTIEFAKNCLNKALDLDIRTAYSNVEQYYNETFKK